MEPITLGNSYILPAHGWCWTRAREIITTAKKFFRLREGAAGGRGEREESRRARALGREAAAHSASAEEQSRKFFYLKGKIKKGKGAPKNKWKNFLLCSPQGERRRWAGLPPCGRQLSGVPLEKGSSGVVKTHQNLTFGKLTDFFVGGAQRRPCVLRGHFLCARRGEPRLPRDLEILSRICFAQFKNI